MEFEGRLMKKEISGNFPDFGAIFMSNASTKEECFERKLLGLPMNFAEFVKRVKAGMILFLFEYEKRELCGVFKAISDGDLNIIPHAYTSSGKKFPAQVSFTTIWHCHTLQEHEFRDAIRNNYFDTYKFNFGLSKDQVHRLLWLFDSRKIRPFQSQSFIDSETRKRYGKSSPEKREMEEDRFSDTKSARKKLKGDIDSFSHSNVESLVCSGKLTVTKDESQLLDSCISRKESDNMHCNCLNRPEGPCSQGSSAFVANHYSSSGQELGNHVIQIQSVSIGEELKEPETSGNSDIYLWDYIPLLSSDDSDSPGVYEDTCQPVFAAVPMTNVGDVHINGLKALIENCQEDNDSDFSRQHTSVGSLYSDASNNRSNVFSRLNFSSRVQGKDDDTRVEKSVHRTIKQKKCYTEVDMTVQEIMEELQAMHDKWNETVRMTRSVERQNEHPLNKNTSVFSRLSRIPEPDVQDNGMSTSSKERHYNQRIMRETKYPASGGKKASVFSRLSRSSEPDVHDSDMTYYTPEYEVNDFTLLQERHDSQMKIQGTKWPVAERKYQPIYLNSDNEEMGNSLTFADLDRVELDDNTYPYYAIPAITQLTRPLKTNKHHHHASSNL